MSIFSQNKKNQQSTETVSTEPYAIISGRGRWGYHVRVTTPDTTYSHGYGYTHDLYARIFKFGRGRAQRYAKRKLAIAKQRYDHARYSETVSTKVNK